MKKVTIKQTEGEEIPAEVIASAIVEIADAMAKMHSTRLKTSAIVTLIQHDTKLSRRSIELVLESVLFLKKTYLKG